MPFSYTPGVNPKRRRAPGVPTKPAPQRRSVTQTVQSFGQQVSTGASRASRRATSRPTPKREGSGMRELLRSPAHVRGEVPELAQARAESFYVNPLHRDWANFQGDIRRMVPGRFNPQPALPRGPEAYDNLIAHAYRGEPEAYFEPQSYGGYSQNPEFRRDPALSVGLHEFVHTRQPKRPLPKWLIEGVAELGASNLARREGIEYDFAEPYSGYLRRARRFYGQ